MCCLPLQIFASQTSPQNLVWVEPCERARCKETTKICITFLCKDCMVSERHTSTACTSAPGAGSARGPQAVATWSKVVTSLGACSRRRLQRSHQRSLRPGETEFAHICHVIEL